MHFDVKFWFERGGLQLVALKPNGDQRIRPHAYYETMLSLLTDKYGNPSSNKSSTEDGMTTKQSEWLLKTTVIEIQYIESLRTETRSLVIQYRKRTLSNDI
jgi:hypothetical protein